MAITLPRAGTGIAKGKSSHTASTQASNPLENSKLTTLQTQEQNLDHRSAEPTHLRNLPLVRL